MADCIELYNVIIIIAVILWVEQVPQHPSPPSFKHCSWQICSAFFSVFLGQIFHFKCWLMFNEFPFNKLSFWVLWSFHSTISLITFSSTSACTSLFVLSFSTTPRDDSFQFTSPSFLVIYLSRVDFWYLFIFTCAIVLVFVSWMLCDFPLFPVILFIIKFDLRCCFICNMSSTFRVLSPSTTERCLSLECTSSQPSNCNFTAK